MRNWMIRIFTGVVLLLATTSAASPQQALTWQEVRAKFEAANPILCAALLSIAEARAQEVTANLRPTSGGIPIVEITMTVPGAMNVIEHLARHHSKMVVGGGTVLDVETAKKCMDAGAHFLTAPGFDCDIVDLPRSTTWLLFPAR